MTAFFYFVLVSLGVTYGLVESAIWAPVRMLLASRGVLLRTLVYCPSCTGFWVAIAVGPIWWSSVFETVTNAFAFIGLLTLMRAQWPDLLLGAYAHEQATAGLHALVNDDERKGS